MDGNRQECSTRYVNVEVDTYLDDREGAPVLPLSTRVITCSACQAEISSDALCVIQLGVEAMRLDGPAAGCEIGDSQVLSLETEQLPRILPFGNRSEPAGEGHTR